LESSIAVKQARPPDWKNSLLHPGAGDASFQQFFGSESARPTIFMNIFLDNWPLPANKYGHCGFQCRYLRFFIF
jgi:hypothetical protein